MFNTWKLVKKKFYVKRCLTSTHFSHGSRVLEMQSGLTELLMKIVWVLPLAPVPALFWLSLPEWVSNPHTHTHTLRPFTPLTLLKAELCEITDDYRVIRRRLISILRCVKKRPHGCRPECYHLWPKRVLGSLSCCLWLLSWQCLPARAHTHTLICGLSAAHLQASVL